mmetsp:Transcript_8243/g.11898  ORF Transcript_8243/g.11898 Transcript_8243/m.11898 type:complete len:89 (+) Transcript_8243:106-372(+)
MFQNQQKLSAWSQINGIFDHNATPIAPPKTRVIIHKKPQQCTSWVPHAIDRENHQNTNTPENASPMRVPIREDDAHQKQISHPNKNTR